LAVEERISFAIEHIEDDSLRGALEKIITFTEPQLSVKDRHEAAAYAYGVEAESFRTSSEKAVLRDFSEELLRCELAWAGEQISELRKRVKILDNTA
jgi:hypothetical protein